MVKPTPDGPPATPPVQHLVVRYAKRGKMRFASHRDVARAFERGVRRAGVPIAHSAGFTPHPKISYAGGAPTGVASEAEYLSLGLTSRSDPAAVREWLNAALPDGIEVINVSEGAGGLPASQLVASEWQVILPGLPPRDVAPAVQEFLALEHAEVERLTSKGMRRMDARPAVVAIDLLASDSVSGNGASAGDATLRMIVKHTVPAVRPDDVLTAMREVSGVTPGAPPLMTRLAQGWISESGVVMP
ncbi:MAG TPA: TIGR03936 family radical SAM-associated protein [Trebonia sp.]